ncbi:MAG: glycosyltransferase, partial [Ginsengibacter sp.]
ILYAGRIGLGISESFFDIAEAIKNLIAKGLKIKLYIQATNSSPLLTELAKHDFVQLNKAVPYNELPRIFAESDLLIMPNDFDNKSISFLRFSMPTKASEYMASGTPILVYSSKETAVTLHALKYNWAYVVSEKNITKLENAISEIYKHKDLRIKLGSTAEEFSISHYDSCLVRDQFRKSFILTQ